MLLDRFELLYFPFFERLPFFGGRCASEVLRSVGGYFMQPLVDSFPRLGIGVIWGTAHSRLILFRLR